MTHDFPEGFLPSGTSTTGSTRTAPHDRLADLDERFVFDYTGYADELGPGQRWSPWDDLEALMKGPEPRPDWVVTSSGAIDTDLGILKTGKEADVFLVERADPHRPEEAVVMAAKRYRDSDHRTFHRAASYTEGRSMKRSRDNRALKRKSTWGRVVAAGEWAGSEWGALRRLWELGVPVPYPVQIDETEIMMEWITHTVDGELETAPRLAQVRPDRALLESYFEQLRDALATMAQAGVVHGDLSPYNTLAAGERLVIIDLPQMVDLVGNPRGMDFLLRDCTNMCQWFRARGLEVDDQELFGDLMAHAF
jgi:RIO kinase 1